MPAVLRIALPVPLPTLFDYLPPAVGQACVGSRVLVPFGRHKLVGVVVAIDAEAAVGSSRLKQVLRLLDDGALLDPELMQTLAWAADYWLGAPGEAYANALPLALREAKPLPPIGDEYWSLSGAGRSAHEAGSRRGGSKALLDLLAAGALSAQELSERQLAYAANDVAYLHQLKTALDQMLAREGRTELAAACFDFLKTRIELDLLGWDETDIFAHR